MSAARWPVPASWAWSSAGEIADIVGGGTPPASDESNFSERGIPWLTPADLTDYDQAHIGNGRRHLSEKGFKSCGATLMPAGTVPFSSRAPIGYCAVASNPISTNQGFKSLVLGAGIQPEYVRYYLISAKDYAEGLASGTTFKELSGARMAQLAIPIAPTSEQSRIVAKVDGLFARRDWAQRELGRIPVLIDHYKRAVLEKAFSGELTADWRAQRHITLPAIAARFSIDGRSEELHAIPPEWAWHSLGDVCDVAGGLTKNQSRQLLRRRMPYLRVANVYANELRLDEVTDIGVTDGEASRVLLSTGDLLIVEGNGSIEQIGRVALWEDQIAGCGHQNHIIRARPCPSLVPRFALYWLLSPRGRAAIEAVASSSSGLHTLSISKVNGLPIPYCAPDEMMEVVREIERRFRSIESTAEDSERAQSMIDHLSEFILAKAFLGKLVPQDPNEEPADKLLANIRGSRGGTSRTRSRAAMA